MNFASDNVYGVHPSILAALSEANSGTAPSYGYDELSKLAEEKLGEVFEKEIRAFLVTTGTVANGLSLSAITPPYGAVICHSEAHTFYDECNSPELFTGGAKVIGLTAPGGKLTPAVVERTLKGFVRGEHDPKPAAVSITNATELGTVYAPEEVKAIADLVRPRGMKLHMDGARFANAIAALGITPAELSWKAGVDVLSFGGTKNGAMMLEAVVFFDTKLAEDFLYRRMRAGQLVSKSRYLGAQMLAYLKDDLWLENARTANRLAQRMAKGLRHRNIKIAFPVNANIIYAVMPRGLHDRLAASGARYHLRVPGEIAETISDDEVVARLVLAQAIPEGDIDRFVSLIGDIGKGHGQ
jgi:threonine aldolase